MDSKGKRLVTNQELQQFILCLLRLKDGQPITRFDLIKMVPSEASERVNIALNHLIMQGEVVGWWSNVAGAETHYRIRRTTASQ